jgi:regulator of sigma E protease
VDVAPYVRLGFSFECGECGFRSTGQKGVRVWTFSDPPVVRQVEPGGPAAAAGLRAGDRLTHIGGIAMTSPEGGRRFTQIKAGDAVEWTVERGGERRTIREVALEREAAGVAPGSAPQRLRYSGHLGDADIEVRGAPVNVAEDPASGEIVIRSRDLLVRVKTRRQDD